MRQPHTWESARWLATLDLYRVGDHYCITGHGEVEYVGEATDPHNSEHVAIFRSIGADQHCVIVTAELSVEALTPITTAEHDEREAEAAFD